ncbi:MAG: HD domain-containing protein [Lachnospiraceae bacterium]|nr:HD domain-containing protein [Lachnospiraceae bacterium]
MRSYYFVTAILSFLNLAVFIFRDNEKKTNYYIKILLIVVCVANLGYLALGVSSTLEEAVLAKKITYLGGCFLPPIIAVCMCSICNIKLKHWLRCLCIFFSAMVYVMVLTAGFSNFYYSSIRMGKVYDATALIVEHGPGYCFFYIILYGYMAVNIAITIIAFIKKQVTKKNLYLLIAMQCITIIAFLLGRAIDPTFEIMPAVYVVDGLILVIIQMQLSQYNLEDSIYVAMQQNNTTGYIVLDLNNKFIGCNEIAKECIPGLADCKVDTFISQEKELDFLCEWIKLFKDSEGSTFAKTLQYKASYYECVIKVLTTGKKNTGYIIELQDCTDRKKYLDLLSDYNAKLKQQVEQQIQHIYLIQQKTVLGMASMVENRDNNTGGHIKRTSDVVGILVETIKENHLLELSDEFCRDLIKAAPMHDLGKISIEDRILQKPGRFTDEEFEIMKTHAEKSAEIIERILRGVEEEYFVNVAVNVARYHHEKWNGMGYPKGLSGEHIPLEARIMAIADVYDALVSKRCYKEAMSFSKAYEIIIESMGSHFDPSLEPVFIMSRDKLESYYTNAEAGEC